MDAERRRLLARAVKAEEDVQLFKDRLAAAYQELAATRAKVSVRIHQVSFEAPAAPVMSDPLVRFFAAISPRREGPRGPAQEMPRHRPA